MLPFALAAGMLAAVTAAFLFGVRIGRVRNSDEAGPCAHPMSQRVDISTMGMQPMTRWYCRQCGYVHDPKRR